MKFGELMGALLCALVLIAEAIWLAVALVRSSPTGSRAFRATPDKVAKAIEDFLEGKGDEEDWDDFLHWKIADPFLESIRRKCEEVSDKYPATENGRYCSEAGIEILRSLLKDVRSRSK